MTRHSILLGFCGPPGIIMQFQSSGWVMQQLPRGRGLCRRRWSFSKAKVAGSEEEEEGHGGKFVESFGVALRQARK